jgi:hypothetical protein
MVSHCWQSKWRSFDGSRQDCAIMTREVWMSWWPLIAGWWLQVHSLQLQCHRHTAWLDAYASWATDTLPWGSASHKGNAVHHDLICWSIDQLQHHSHCRQLQGFQALVWSSFTESCLYIDMFLIVFMDWGISQWWLTNAGDFLFWVCIISGWHSTVRISLLCHHFMPWCCHTGLLHFGLQDLPAAVVFKLIKDLLTVIDPERT